LLEYLRKEFNVTYPPVVIDPKDKYVITYADINDSGDSTSHTAYELLFYGKAMFSRDGQLRDRIFDDWKISPEIIDVIKSLSFSQKNGCYISRHLNIEIPNFSEDMSHEEKRLLMIQLWIAFKFFNKELALSDINPDLIEKFNINHNHIKLINHMVIDGEYSSLESGDKHAYGNKYEPIKGIMEILRVDIENAERLYGEMLTMYPHIVKETISDSKIYKVHK
jgi:hypothetical protein